MNIKSIKLEDGIEYMVLDEIDLDNNTYVYLTNVDDEEDFCIRKVDNTKNDSMLVGLDTDNEFDKALLLFSKKYQDIV
jgi:hypothetical protein